MKFANAKPRERPAGAQASGQRAARGRTTRSARDHAPSGLRGMVSSHTKPAGLNSAWSWPSSTWPVHDPVGAGRPGRDAAEHERRTQVRTQTGVLSARAGPHIKRQVPDDQAPLLHVQALARHLARPHQRPRARLAAARAALAGLQHAVVQLRHGLQRALHLRRSQTRRPGCRNIVSADVPSLGQPGARTLSYTRKASWPAQPSRCSMYLAASSSGTGYTTSSTCGRAAGCFGAACAGAGAGCARPPRPGGRRSPYGGRRGRAPGPGTARAPAPTRRTRPSGCPARPCASGAACPGCTRPALPSAGAWPAARRGRRRGRRPPARPPALPRPRRRPCACAPCAPRSAGAWWLPPPAAVAGHCCHVYAGRGALAG